MTVEPSHVTRRETRVEHRIREQVSARRRGNFQSFRRVAGGRDLELEQSESVRAGHGVDLPAALDVHDPGQETRIDATLHGCSANGVGVTFDAAHADFAPDLSHDLGSVDDAFEEQESQRHDEQCEEPTALGRDAEP